VVASAGSPAGDSLRQDQLARFHANLGQM